MISYFKELLLVLKEIRDCLHEICNCVDRADHTKKATIRMINWNE